MSTPGNPDPQSMSFIRQSDTESTCMSCFQKVRTDRYVPLEEAEDIHANVCLVKPGSSVRYVLL